MTEELVKSFTSSPFGDSVNLDEIYENFEFLDDWEERYSYIIDLGKQLPSFPEEHKIEDNYVHGCQSQVWLIHHYDAESKKLYLLIESDAIIVKGLAAVVLTILNKKTASEVAEFDVEAVFEKLDLIRHISPTRGNGLRSMIDKIKKVAQTIS